MGLPIDDLALVRKAIDMGATVVGCCEWNERAFRRLTNDPGLLGLTLSAIRKLVIEFVKLGGKIEEIAETRSEYASFDHYYKLIVPYADFKQGLFVEIRLIDSDEDCPSVAIVNARPIRVHYKRARAYRS